MLLKYYLVLLRDSSGFLMILWDSREISMAQKWQLNGKCHWKSNCSSSMWADLHMKWIGTRCRITWLGRPPPDVADLHKFAYFASILTRGFDPDRHFSIRAANWSFRILSRILDDIFRILSRILDDIFRILEDFRWNWMILQDNRWNFQDSFRILDEISRILEDFRWNFQDSSGFFGILHVFFRTTEDFSGFLRIFDEI